MRTKTTAKKLVESNDEIDESNIKIPMDIDENKENPIKVIGDNEFLEDGTLVIQPTDVEDTKIDNSECISFEQFTNELMKNFTNNLLQNIPSNESDTNKTQNESSNGSCGQNKLMVKCTACNKKYNPFVHSNFQIHPALSVIICKACLSNQKGNYFTIDSKDNKETLCRWCVDGGRLICCDYCAKSFCKSCIKRNLGSDFLKSILTQSDDVKWKCFVCEPDTIFPLQTYCKMIEEQVNSNNQKKPRNMSSGASSGASSVVSSCPANKSNSATIHPISGVAPTTIVNSPTIIPAMTTTTSSIVPPTCSTKSQISLTNVFQPINNQRHRHWIAQNRPLQTTLDHIDQIQTTQLLPAISATKKCIEAFHSDIRNLELEIGRVSSIQDLQRMTSLFQGLYRHHIANRFGQLQKRIEEEAVNLVVTPAAAVVKHQVFPSTNIVSITTAVTTPVSSLSGITITNVTSSNSNNNNQVITTKSSINKRKRSLQATKSRISSNNSNNNNNNKSTNEISIDLTDESEPSTKHICKHIKPTRSVAAGDDSVAVTTASVNEQEVVDLSDDDDDDDNNHNSSNNNGVGGEEEAEDNDSVLSENLNASTIDEETARAILSR